MTSGFGFPITDEEVENFIALCEGLKLGRHKDELRPLIDKFEAMQRRGLSTPEGQSYLQDHATQRQLQESRSGISDQPSETTNSHPDQ